MNLTIGFWIYVALTSIALFPPLFGIKPFTVLFANLTQPMVVRKTMKFKKTCLILNYMWCVTFVICAILSMFNYSDTKWLNITLQNGIPALIQICIALPLTIIGQKWLPQHIYEPNNFKSVHDLFEIMPYGLNLRYAKRLQIKGIEEGITVQFNLSGREPLEGYLTFNRTSASFNYGVAESPRCTVYADSDLWLGISNGTEDAIKHSVARDYRTEGDSSIMLHLLPLFTTKHKVEDSLFPKEESNLYQEYKSFTPLNKPIKNVVVFYSGDRSDDISKTFFMVENLRKGLEEGGANVEIVKLKEKKINYCAGCYQCWTKTPGKCIHQDDMGELLKYFDSADLMVFASPLYVFSVNGRMKSFLDRMIPYIKPYMAFDNLGNTYHPKRFKNIPPIVVVSAGGFPEVGHNFDGLRTLFRDYANHMEGSSIRGELILPAAEFLSIKAFEFRRDLVASLCKDAGKSLVEKGYIPVEIMRQVSNIGMQKSYFGQLSNIFWENLDGKEPYLKYIKEEIQK